MKHQDEIRKSVQNDYARAVQKPNTGCCGTTPTPKGVAAKMAGYQSEDVENIPVEAVENSFGCGNPVAFSDVKVGETVVDLGSGAGLDLFIAAEKVGPSGHIIGVDMTDAMIEKARQNIAKAGHTNIEIRKGIIEELPVDDGSVDWVISNCVINLSPEKSKVFAEIYRILKPGGHMSVSDIVAENIPAELAENQRIYSACLAGAIGEEAYMAGLREAGLVSVEIRERLVYEASQLEGFLKSELRVDGGSGDLPSGDAKSWAQKLAGSVASVRVVAQKPNHG